uniref:Family with sequence similarity 78 member B n=1 Tax=Laticauda laticaudata TaxID=8630 RepID=A0A8C5S0I7_LATLA
MIHGLVPVRGPVVGDLCSSQLYHRFQIPWYSVSSLSFISIDSLSIFAHSKTFFIITVSSWELPDLREGRVKAISDSDGVSYPWYGNTTETVTLIGPTNKVTRFSVSMNDNFYPSVTWAVPVSDSNVPLLTRIKRDQSFTTWLVAMNMTTKEKIILQTIKWRMTVDIEVDPMQLLGKRARLVGKTLQEQPKILSRMEPIPPNALVKPNANDAQVLMWRPKRGLPLVVIPPK